MIAVFNETGTVPSPSPGLRQYGALISEVPAERYKERGQGKHGVIMCSCAAGKREMCFSSVFSPPLLVHAAQDGSRRQLYCTFAAFPVLTHLEAAAAV